MKNGNRGQQRKYSLTIAMHLRCAEKGMVNRI